MKTIKFFTQSEMPIVTDEHFWLIDMPPFNSSTRVIRYEGDLLKDTLKKKHPEFEHYPNVYKYKDDYFYYGDRIPSGKLIKTANIFGHRPVTIVNYSIGYKYLNAHL